MAIVATDIEFHLSGAAGTPLTSIGGAIHATTIVDATVDNLFSQVSSAEAVAGLTEYRCFYVKNAHATLTLQNAATYILTDAAPTDQDTEIAIGSSPVNGVERTMVDSLTNPLIAAAWLVSNDYAVGDYVEPTVANGYLYEATADAGSSAATEPVWPTTLGATVVDSGITWTCRAKNTFQTLAGVANKLTIGDIPVGQWQAIWIKRVITAGAVAANATSAVIRVVGDTAA